MALVTGAESPFGAAVALVLAAAGTRLVLAPAGSAEVLAIEIGDRTASFGDSLPPSILAMLAEMAAGLVRELAS